MSDHKTAREVRTTFLEFFKQQGHEAVASGPLVPSNDPTLMFANAGMVQFKDVFTGREARPYKRATSSQKCIRISGKHNDLENVGRTARHHTFFEMLGNFSFGDYFKEEAIVWAWDLVTKSYGISKDRLVVTYFKGEQGIAADEQARSIWKKVTGYGDDRVIGMGMADNFWSMGDTGPCGPCSEIHYHHGHASGGPGRHGSGAVDPATFGEEPTPDGMGWMEIWNLVFMQFERFADGAMKPLPAPSVDTGMGLERITSVVQGVTSNYDTDLLRVLVDQASTISGKKYSADMSDDAVSMRVIADHARTTAFLIAEGVFPDRGGREYVLRRVMRRAIRHGHRLGIDKPFLHKVCERVIDLMGDDYRELRDRRGTILDVAEQEEVRFRQTIKRGLEILDDALAKPDVTKAKLLPGNTAFTLYDTYGFPLDLTEVICEERGFSVDAAGYQRSMDDARARSEGSKVGEAAVADVHHKVAGRVGATTFVGHDAEHGASQIVAIVHHGVEVENLAAGHEAEIVVKQTPFYAESGGQIGDRGVIVGHHGARFVVSDTTKPVGGTFVHKGKLENGALNVGDTVELEVDHDRRSATRRNHSATHLLHFALRHVLGEHVQQKGSLVGPDRLRFDYAHGKALSEAEVTRIEEVVNEMVLANAEVNTQVLPIDQAKAAGAMAIFEEKYGDVVRVLTMDAGRYKSVELCGGTHARRTGDIGMFRVTTDKAIAAGVRRIEATTGLNTLREAQKNDRAIAPVLRALNVELSALPAKIDKLLADERALEKKVAELEKKIALGGGVGGGKSGGGLEAMLDQARTLQGAKVLAVRSPIGDAGALRELADTLRDKLAAQGEGAIVLIGAESAGKAMLVLTVSKSLTAKFKAGELIRPIAALVGGSGGGRPDMAQAGGTDPSKLDAALNELYARLG
ncbi:MAG: alanine--tRNA ligase [Deltaproteobacteria bacterium]|nr:alanine--tRNA ligase [Deltaproteobacteria bacterium]